MSFEVPEEDLCYIELDAVSSRISVTSITSTGSGILDAFPLPPEIEAKESAGCVLDFGADIIKNETSQSPLIKTKDDENYAQEKKQVNSRPVMVATTPNGLSSSSERNPFGQPMHFPRDHQPSSAHTPQSLSQQRLLRYGRASDYKGIGYKHAHTMSFNGSLIGGSQITTNVQHENASLLNVPKLSRSHSLSKSWDAGVNFDWTLAANTPSHLQSWQAYVQSGSQAFVAGHLNLACRHWRAAAFAPWNSAIARVLLKVGFTEKWFMQEVNVPYVDLKLIHAGELKSLINEILVPVREGLINLAFQLRRIKDYQNSVCAYELAGSLGSREAILSAAKIYSKGDKCIKKDVTKAKRLYDLANSL